MQVKQFMCPAIYSNVKTSRSKDCTYGAAVCNATCSWIVGKN